MKYISSHILIEKVESCCNDFYLNSVQFAKLRESLRNRIAALNNYHRTHTLDCAQSDLQHGLISDYEQFCKHTCSNFPADMAPGNPHMNKYFKHLHKQLSTALNKLDRCWGYRGVRGYGIDYGKCHIEMEMNVIKLARKYNTALDFIKKLAEETKNEECLQMLNAT